MIQILSIFIFDTNLISNLTFDTNLLSNLIFDTNLISNLIQILYQLQITFESNILRFTKYRGWTHFLSLMYFCIKFDTNLVSITNHFCIEFPAVYKMQVRRTLLSPLLPYGTNGSPTLKPIILQAYVIKLLRP